MNVKFGFFFLFGCLLIEPILSSESNLSTHSALIKDLKGIVLLGKNKLKENGENVEDIDCIDLLIPGHINELYRNLHTFLDKPATTETIASIKEAIVEHYRRENRPFVVVKVPEQEITSGVLQFLVLESKLDKLSVEGNRYVSSEKLKNYCRIEPGDPIDQNRLIRAVSFINRNPFRRVDLIFAPGTEEGSTNIILSTKDRRPFRIYSGTDNLGVEPIGPNQWYAGFSWGNAFGLDHLLSYQFTSSYNMHYFQAHTIEYIAPLSWGHLLDIYGGYSQVHPPVLPPMKRNDGWSMQTSARYLVPLNISPYLEHEIVAGGDFKRTNNTFEFTEDFPIFGRNTNLTQLALGYSGNYERNTYRIDFKGTVFWSPGQWLADQSNSNYSSLRPGAVNHWVYFRGFFTYLQRLPRSFSFSLRLQGQGATQPLLPSEQFGLGGYETVRGYEEREINVDNVLIMNLEARSPGLPIAKRLKSSIPDALQFLVFMDAGWGDNNVVVPGSSKTNYLIGAGPGARYTLEPYITARLDWGIRLHNQTTFEGNWSRLHFNLTASY